MNSIPPSIWYNGIRRVSSCMHKVFSYSRTSVLPCICSCFRNNLDYRTIISYSSFKESVIKSRLAGGALSFATKEEVKYIVCEKEVIGRFNSAYQFRGLMI